jgi:SAM-dependent methyltransferase
MFYKNIAEIYASSRPPYPKELFEIILSKLPQSHHNLLLDLGCGTGELLLPLSSFFKNSFGIDPDEDMLKVATNKMKKMNINNAQLIQSTSENYLTNLEHNVSFDLVTAGRSFHWMQQELVAQKVYDYLKPAGIFAVLGEANGGIWKRKTLWAEEVRHIIFEHFPHKQTFIPAKGHSTSLEIIKSNLNKVPFKTMEDFIVETQQEWTIPMIINLFYSASGFLDWLGHDKNEFEKQVNKILLQLNPSGNFEIVAQFGITCCTK